MVVLDFGIIMVVVGDMMRLEVIAVLLVVGSVSSLAVVVDALAVLPVELVKRALLKEVGVVVIFAAIVVAALGTAGKAMEEGVGEREVEEWDSYVTPAKFPSSSSLCLLGGLSTCLPKAVCVSVCGCTPCACVPMPVCGSCVRAIAVSE